MSANNKRLTNEEFIKRAKAIHGDTYDYSLVNYVNTKIKVKLICPIHGVFEQTSGKHLIGRGCVDCGNEKSKMSQRTKLPDFIENSNSIHNNKYDYSQVDYQGALVKIKIACPIHDIFEQRPSDHLKGHGCDKCYKDSLKVTKEDFIKRSKDIHNKYDYSQVEYVDYRTKVKIVCPIHDIFEQRPSQHLIGQGCTLCRNIGRRKRRLKHISESKLNGAQLFPSFNKEACKLFDKISEEKNTYIQHAMNGGEFHIKELDYWVDGYDEENNIVYEYDEKHHSYEKQQKKDKIRQKEITKLLNCKFVRIKEQSL